MGIISTKSPNSDLLTAELITKNYSENKFNNVTVNHIEGRIPNRTAGIYVDCKTKAMSENQGFATHEHIISFDDLDDGLLQIFRASTSNIYDLIIPMKGEDTTFSPTIVDECNYGTPAAATDAWVSTSNNTKVSIESSIVYESPESLAFTIKSPQSGGDTITKTFSPALDWSNKIAIDFYWYSGDNSVWKVNIIDSLGNKAWLQFSDTVFNIWQQKDFNISFFTDIALIDLSNITELQFEIVTANSDVDFYVDYIHVEELGSNPVVAEVELYDFGTNASPTTLGTPLTLDTGETSITKVLTNYKKIQYLTIRHGSDSTIPANVIIPGNYYGIHIKKPTLGKIIVYGTNYKNYNNGDLYRDNAGTLTALNQSITFAVYTVVPSLIRSIELEPDGHADSSYAYFQLMNINKSVKKFLGVVEFHNDNRLVKLEYDYSQAEEVLTNNDEYLVLFYQDSSKSLTEKIEIRLKFQYNSFEVYG